jgi:DNA repair protein RecO (recombination protein O)
MAGKTNRDVGAVLRTYKLGESDRIVVFLTTQHGKIRGVAKGARKSGSKYSARLEPGSVVDFQWISGKSELVRITQVETVNSNRHLRENLDLFSSAQRMLEAVDLLCEDNTAHEDLALMIIRALKTMNETKSAATCGAFLFKALSLEGFAPSVTNCFKCGTADNLNSFSITKGSFFCDDCTDPGCVIVLDHTREMIEAIFDGRLNAVISNEVSNITQEVEALAVAMIEYHTGKRLKSLLLV